MTAKKAQTSIASSHFNGLFLYAESTVIINTYHETIHYKPLITGGGCYSRDRWVYFHQSFYALNSIFYLPPAVSVHNTDISTNHSPAAILEEAAQEGAGHTLHLCSSPCTEDPHQ